MEPIGCVCVLIINNCLTWLRRLTNSKHILWAGRLEIQESWWCSSCLKSAGGDPGKPMVLKRFKDNVLQNFLLLWEAFCFLFVLFFQAFNWLGESYPHYGGQFAYSEFTDLMVVAVVVQSPSHVQLFATPWTAAHQASLSLTRVCPSSCSAGWCHPTTSSSVAPFSSCPQSFPASGSFQMVISSKNTLQVDT